MNTEIRLTAEGSWYLLIWCGDECLVALPHDRLVDALDTANTLRIHVDNASELPIGQYKLAG